VNHDQLERHYLRRVIGLVLVALFVGGLVAAVLYSSRLGAQVARQISVQCVNGICPVPEADLLRLVQAYSEAQQFRQLCGKTVKGDS
jgi:cell division septal protein FtsQ